MCWKGTVISMTTDEIKKEIKMGIDVMEGSNDAYSTGFKNGLIWILSVIENRNPTFESVGNEHDNG